MAIISVAKNVSLYTLSESKNTESKIYCNLTIIPLKKMKRKENLPRRKKSKTKKNLRI